MAFHNRVAFQASSQPSPIVLPLENMSVVQKVSRVVTPLLHHITFHWILLDVSTLFLFVVIFGGTLLFIIRIYLQVYV